MTDAAVLEFAEQFHNAVIDRARNESGGTSEFLEEAFTGLAIEYLAGAGMIIEGNVCHFERRIGTAHARADAFYIDDDEDDRLDLFVSIFHGTETPSPVSRDDVVRAVKQGLRFVQSAVSNFHASMEPSDPAVPMAREIYDKREELRELRIFVLTDGIAREKALRSKKGIPVIRAPLGDVRTTVQVWDIERIARSASTGGSREAIEVDIEKDFGGAIPCLPVPLPGAAYRSYLAVLPGMVLQKLYEDYGERLLEMNVRSFLQARGKINKGIRTTILEEPQQFFAYNNGITAVADDVVTCQMQDGGTGITRIRGLQIVNGGQTTASIHQAIRKDRAVDKVEAVSVQAKISVVAPDQVETMVSRISRYANSQNKVSDADFSASDPFHQKLEELSRTVWTADGQTHWFYERARGQYQVTRFKEGRTKVQQRSFDARNPAAQMFTKTDLATFVHSWGLLPHIVSRGSQKNFQEFAIRLRRDPAMPDPNYFKDLCARAIIFRAAQKLARDQQISPFRANVVTYSVAYLSSVLGDQLRLRDIWDRQQLPPWAQQLLSQLLRRVYEFIVESSQGKNPTEWCKRPECWDRLRSAELLDATMELPSSVTPRTGSASHPAGPELARAADLARDCGFEVIDKTYAGGALWVVGDNVPSTLSSRLAEMGLICVFRANGGRATEHRPAWEIARTIRRAD